jgi:hypothetical protein
MAGVERVVRKKGESKRCGRFRITERPLRRRARQRPFDILNGTDVGIVDPLDANDLLG